MGKKKNPFIDEDYGVDYNPGSAAAVSKLPNNVTGGAQLLKDYMNIPVDKITEYTGKGTRDFSPWSRERFEELVESVKQCGIMEAVTVRVHPHDDEMYEMLAGEHRWKAAIEAGLSVIPANVLRECDDERAENVFICTNLLRRELSLRDKVYGWSHYVKQTRYKHRSEIEELIESGVLPQSLKNPDISIRQIYRYARLNELIDVFLNAVDKGNISLRGGIVLSYIPKEKQEDLIPYLEQLKGEALCEQLRQLAFGKLEGKTWDTETLESLFMRKGKDPEAEKNKFTYVIKSAKPVLKNRLNPAYYRTANDILNEALTMYFKEHPECERQEKKKKEKKAEES